MNDIQLEKGLGLAGLVAGAFKLAAGRTVSRALGAGSPALVRLFGARNIVSGIAVLAYPDNPAPSWTRVAGDLMELAVVATALGRGNRHRGRAGLAALLLVGATLTDLGAAAALHRRGTRALDTARRTRVKQIGTT